MPGTRDKQGRPESSPADGGPAGARGLALRVVTQPRDTNHYGTIFGGVILSYIDQAGFVEARRHGVHRWVTVAMDRVEFKQPVHLGDVVNFYATVERAGTSSLAIRVDVEAERYSTGLPVAVTSALVTLVAVDAAGRPIPFRSAATTGDTEPGPRRPAGPPRR